MTFFRAYGDWHIHWTAGFEHQNLLKMSPVIQFNFVLDKGRLEVFLEADIERDVRDGYFFVKNFRKPGNGHTSILPEIMITKVGDRWVHRDSGLQTELSKAVGEAIDSADLGRIETL